MKKKGIFILFCLIFFGCPCIRAKNSKISAIPYYLKKYQPEYNDSPRKASLAWFEDSRLWMFIHWGVWGKHHSAFAIYSNRIPLNANLLLNFGPKHDGSIPEDVDVNFRLLGQRIRSEIHH